MNKKKKQVYRKKYTKSTGKKKGNKFTVWWRNLKRSRKALIISGVSLLLVFSMLFGYVYFRYIGNINRTNIDKDIVQVEKISEDIVNIGLFGIDTRDGLSFSGNADSIMILSINTKTNKINIFSIMRDSLVPIEGYKTTKINAAYAYGGPAMAINTINSNFGLDISDYVTVNFYGMEKIIDAVGGIEVPVTEDEMERKTGAPKGMLNQCILEQAAKDGTKAVLVKEAGTQVLTGRQAVAWARIRKAENYWGTTDDYGRTERQRYVMQQLFTKATSLSFTKYPALIDAMLPCTETSMSNSEILSLATVLTKGGVSLETARIPSDDMIISGGFSANGASTVYFNLDDAKALVHAVIYDGMTAEEFESSYTYSKEPWYYSSGSSGGGSYDNTSSYDTSSEDTSSEDITDPDDTYIDDDSDITDTDDSLDDDDSSGSYPDDSDYEGEEPVEPDTDTTIPDDTTSTPSTPSTPSTSSTPPADSSSVTDSVVASSSEPSLQ